MHKHGKSHFTTKYIPIYVFIYFTLVLQEPHVINYI